MQDASDADVAYEEELLRDPFQVRCIRELSPLLARERLRLSNSQFQSRHNVAADQDLAALPRQQARGRAYSPLPDLRARAEDHAGQVCASSIFKLKSHKCAANRARPSHKHSAD